MAETHTDRIDDNPRWTEGFLETGAGAALRSEAATLGALFAAGNPEVLFPIQQPVMTAHGCRTSNLSCASRVGARVTSPNRVNNQPT